MRAFLLTPLHSTGKVCGPNIYIQSVPTILHSDGLLKLTVGLKGLRLVTTISEKIIFHQFVFLNSVGIYQILQLQFSRKKKIPNFLNLLISHYCSPFPQVVFSSHSICTKHLITCCPFFPAPPCSDRKSGCSSLPTGEKIVSTSCLTEKHLLKWG